MICPTWRVLVGGIVEVFAAASLVTCAPTDWIGDGLGPATCDDAKTNGDETDVDCGGPSCRRCVIGDACRTDSDCASGDCGEGTCREAHCSNLVVDSDEEAVDCGGNDCEPCAVSATCANRVQDADETDIDCGGLSGCDRCRNGDSCTSDDDCMSGRCDDRVCVASTSSTGGASGEGGAGNEGGQGEGGGAGTHEAGAPNAGAGGSSDQAGGTGPSLGGSQGTGATETGGSASGGTGGLSIEGGAAGAESMGGTDGPGGTTAEGGAATGGNGSGGETGGTGGTTGGASGTGGTATGGTATGGTATGGTATGGTATGGTATGGTATGGTATGGTATGGTGGMDPCTPRPPPTDGLITDLSEFTAGTTWNSGERPWGDADFSGTTQTYGSSGTQLTATITSGHALQLSSGFPNENFVGLGLLFDACADASTFAGLSFTVSGNLGGATLYVQLRTVGNLPNDQACGACAYASEQTKWDDCVFNTKNVTGVSGSPQTIKVPWTEFTGGKPNPTSSSTSELLGVQIQFECGQSSGCGPNVTFDDFAFYE